jgi:hypothetical protein
MASDEWLVRSDVRPRCLSIDRMAAAKFRALEGFGMAAVWRSRAPRLLGSLRTDGLASTAPVIVSTGSSVRVASIARFLSVHRRGACRSAFPGSEGIDEFR